jgi:hypothetical protein
LIELKALFMFNLLDSLKKFTLQVLAVRCKPNGWPEKG